MKSCSLVMDDFVYCTQDVFSVLDAVFSNLKKEKYVTSICLAKYFIFFYFAVSPLFSKFQKFYSQESPSIII